jgi:hypothetical protein
MFANEYSPIDDVEADATKSSDATNIHTRRSSSFQAALTTNCSQDFT